MTIQTLERFLVNIQIRESECWEWIGKYSTNGYGRICIHAFVLRAHRLAYEHWVRPIPEGYHIDHLCKNKGCVNPDHLEAVPPAVNISRGLRGTKHPRG